MANSFSSFKTSIWGMDHSLSLEDIQRIQQDIDYTENIEYLDEYRLDEGDKKLLHNWEITSDIKYYQPKNSEVPIRYYTSEGHFESAVSKQNAFVDSHFKQLLPRDRRISQKTSHVIFLEMNERVYSIVYGGASAFQVRTILMGRGLKQRRREEWGKVDETLPQYTFGSDFFYWIYNKYETGGIVQTPNGDVQIRDVEGIGRFSDRQQHNTRGRGPKSTGEISNKTALGIDQLVYESDFILDFDNMNLIFGMDEYGSCTIDKKRTIYIDDNGDIGGVVGKEPDILLSLYIDILPGLLSAYHEEQLKKTWTPVLALQAKRNWATDVIIELCLHHGITKRDLINLPNIK